MPNIFFQDLLKTDIKTLISESLSIDKISHQGIKGNIREYGFGKLLSKYLPLDWDIGKGQIHDSDGLESSETDVLIFNKNIIPPILFGELLGLYPLESCKYAFEIKTKSTATEIQTTIDKFRTLQKLKSITGVNEIHRVYLALSSDLTKTSELERYKKYDPNFSTNPAANVIMVLGQGYWYYVQGHKDDGNLYGAWQFCEPQNDNFELGFLLGGIINTLNSGKPPFGYYILPNGKMKLVEEKQI